MSNEKILEKIIEGYRNSIDDRYQYLNIINKINLPQSIDEEAVSRIRNYFLDFIYPEFTKRQELNEAFESLDVYIKSPEKLLNILLTSVKLIFSHGRHLPKILNTGLKALKSFRAGTKFESKLVEHAVENQIFTPFDTSKINLLISKLPRHEMEEFINHSHTLIEVFHDYKLVGKIKEILQYLIIKMNENRNLYSENDIRGMELGYEMLEHGDLLFRSFEKKDQDYIITMIIQLEKTELKEIFEGS